MCLSNMKPTPIVEDSAPGCHIAIDSAEWILGTESFDYDAFGLPSEAEVPDISIDPEARILTVANPSATAKVYYITIETEAEDKFGRKLSSGSWTDSSGAQRECLTFILRVPSNTLMDVCTLPGPSDIKHIRVDSDIVEYLPHPKPFDAVRENCGRFCFPLEGKGPFRCTQGINGCLTHFAHPSTFHAVDFECPVGTPIVAVASGVITSIQQTNTATGIHVSNLFKWNSITLELEDGIVVEYVHIETGSARVETGERVKQGQIICLSGSVGFCPIPHLHIEMHASSDRKAPSLIMPFRSSDSANPRDFVPKVGHYYNSTGERNSPVA